jgi:hypothetical protein
MKTIIIHLKGRQFMEAGSGSGHFSFTNIRLFLQDENVIRGQRESVNEMKIFRAFAFMLR